VPDACCRRALPSYEITVRIDAAVMLVQGVYYLVTGLWPIVHMASFEAVTGPKTDDWLVETVGLLAASIGATLVVHARGPTAPAFVLAAATAASFAAIDIVHTVLGTISPVYLADAVVQAAFLALFGVARARAFRDDEGSR
jgi:hypothetical protein